MLNFKLAASRFVNVSVKEINVIEENTMPKSKKGAHKFGTMHQYEFFAVKFRWRLAAYLATSNQNNYNKGYMQSLRY